MNQCLKISIARGGCRFATPLYLGSSYVLSFEGSRSDEAHRVLLVKPRSKDSADADGIVVLAESVVADDEITLSLNRNVLVEWFKSNKALDVESYVDAHCYVFNEQGDSIADSPVVIEYSPESFVIDTADYPLAREILLQAASAKDQAIDAKDAAISAKESAISAKSAAESASLAAANAQTATEEASSAAQEAAVISSEARDDARAARNAAQDARTAAEESASTVEMALGKMIASAKKVTGGVEVLLWNGQGNKPVPIFIPNGIDGVTGYVKCDEDNKYYRVKCKVVYGQKVLVLEQVGVDDVDIETGGYVRSVNGTIPDAAGNVAIPLDFLPLAGGSLTGSLILPSNKLIRIGNLVYYSDGLRSRNKSSVLLLYSGTAYNDSPALSLFGTDFSNAELAGKFVLRAGADAVALIGSPNGTLTWNGKAVTLAGDCLPITGGTLTGNLVISGHIRFSLVDSVIRNTNPAGRIIICGGETVNIGSSLTLNSSAFSGASGGAFSLRAHDGTNSKALTGKPDGTLTWNNKNVTLAGDCLPISGGVMTGLISFNIPNVVETTIRNSDTSKSLRISGGTSWNDGASVVVYGQTHSTSAGWFRIKARNETTSKILEGRPDGTLTWDGKAVLLADGHDFVRSYSSSSWRIIELGDGLVMMWLYVEHEDDVFDAQTYTLPIPMKNTNYSVFTGINGIGGGYNERHNITRTSTNFTVEYPASDGWTGFIVVGEKA